VTTPPPSQPSAEERTLSQIIARAVNEHYGYDLFDEALGDAVVTALAEAGYEIAPASLPSPPLAPSGPTEPGGAS
jgi:hypothetical protein